MAKLVPLDFDPFEGSAVEQRPAARLVPLDFDPFEVPIGEDLAAGRITTGVSNLGRGVADIASALPKGVAIDLEQGYRSMLRAFDRIDQEGPRSERPVYSLDGRGEVPAPHAHNLEAYRQADADGRAALRQKYAAADPRESGLYKAGQWISDAVKRALPVNPEFAEEWLTTKIPHGLGSLTGFAILGVAGRGVGLPGMATPAAAGSLLGASGQFEEALEHGASMEDAFRASDIGAVIGTSEALPISRLLDRLDAGTGGSIKKLVREAIKQGTEEAVQETFQTIMANLIAGEWVEYDPEREWFDGTGEAAGVGFSVGSLASIILGLAYPGGRRGSLPGEPDSQQGAAAGLVEPVVGPQPQQRSADGSVLAAEEFSLPDGAVPAASVIGDVVGDSPAPPKRMAQVTEADEASPLQTEAISRGKAIIEDAVAGRPLDVGRSPVAEGAAQPDPKISTKAQPPGIPGALSDSTTPVTARAQTDQAVATDQQQASGPESTTPVIAPRSGAEREFQAATRTPPRPQTLSDFIRAKGGLDPSDPAVADLRAIADTGAFRLLGKPARARTGLGGRPFDEMREIAAERGFLPTDSTIADFLDAIAQDVKAPDATRRVYSAEDMSEVTAYLDAMQRISETDRELYDVDLSRFPSLDVARSYAGSRRELEDMIEEAEAKLDALDDEIERLTREGLALTSSTSEEATRGGRDDIPFDFIGDRTTAAEGARPRAESPGPAGETAGERQESGGAGEVRRSDQPRQSGRAGAPDAPGDVGGAEGVATERTDQGEQILAPGVKPVTDLDRIEAQRAKPLQADARQKPLDDGLFDVAARGQGDLLSAAAAQADPAPTEAQKEAGNYKMGHVRWGGMDITIETARGEERSGVGGDGKPWSVMMPAHYGYIKRTEGADGDHVDVYLGDQPAGGTVYIVDQVDAKTGKFDEHKVMLGFPTTNAAVDTYFDGFSDGRGPIRLGAMTPLSLDEFKAWLEGDTSKPVGTIGSGRETAIRLTKEETAAPTIEPYTDKSIIVRGVTEAEGNKRFAGMTARPLWNARAKGWVFSKKREAEVRSRLAAPGLKDPAPKGGVIDRVERESKVIKAAADAAPKAPPMPRATVENVFPESARRQIGTNVDGNTVFEDGRGVRSFVEGGIRQTEAVQMDPRGAVSVDKRRRGASFMTAEESAPKKPTRTADYGANNKLVTADRAELARERLRAKLRGQLSAGIDPEIMAEGAILAVYHVEAGARRFADFARAVIEDLGPGAKPFLRMWYNAARDYPGVMSGDMTPYAEVAGADIDALLWETDDGVQGPVPDGDARASAADVQPPVPDRSVGRVRSEESGRGEADVPGSDGRGAEGRGRSGQGAMESGSRGGREGGPDRVPAGRRDGDRKPAAAASVTGENFSIAPGALAEGRGWKRKAEENVRAIELMREIEAAGRPATTEEQAELALYVGWGGIKGAFPDGAGEYGKGFEEVGAKVKALLSDVEYATARRSIQYAHYTAEDVVRAMWTAAGRMGFGGGKVFEPGMGVGNFAGMMPAAIASKTSYSGLELDHTTARIARLLYPKWGVRQDDFTKAPLPKDAYDLVIGNPPFADIAITSDPEYKAQGFLLHDYFFAKSLDGVRPGGLLMFISSAGTMNKVDTKAREYMADRADLVGAVRLPGNAFSKNAGTEVTTDIIVLRKRLPGEEAGSRAWTETVEVNLPNRDGTPTAGRVNRYFVDNPDMVLGEEGFFDKLYVGRYAVQARPGVNIADALAEAFDKLPRDILSPWQDTTTRAEVDFGTSERKEGTFYQGPSGDLYQVRSGVGEKVGRRGKGVTGGKTAAEIERITKLIPVRDSLRDVYAADLAGDTENANIARARLNKAYDAFVKKFGPINKAEFSHRRPTSVQANRAPLPLPEW